MCSDLTSRIFGDCLDVLECTVLHCSKQNIILPYTVSLIRKIQKAGFKPEAATDYIWSHAPAQYQSDYAQLWANFVDEAQGLLTSDAVGALDDALALLRRECNVK